MYLVDNFSINDNSDKMGLVSVVDEVSKKHLQNSAQDSEYHVINLDTLEYFDPSKNKWVKIMKNWLKD